ncbi:MAG: hypothetical protein ACT4ON_16045 [Bacteroidota bacterium]
MRKLFLLISFVCFLQVRSNGQQSTTVRINKTDIISYKDIKPLLAAADPGKDYTSYRIHSFNLSGTGTEGDNSISFIENSSCGKFTEKQRSLIEKYNKKGMVFTLEEITIIKLGEPGTPYNPQEQIAISTPNVSFTIKE